MEQGPEDRETGKAHDPGPSQPAAPSWESSPSQGAPFGAAPYAAGQPGPYGTGAYGYAAPGDRLWSSQQQEPLRSQPKRKLSLRGRALKVGVGIGAAAGVAVGAALIAGAATSSGSTPQTSSTTGSSAASPSDSSSSSSSSTTTPSNTPSNGSTNVPGPGPRSGYAFGPGMGAGGPVIHGQYTVQGPNGYETLDTRTGTVSDVSNTSGSTWSLTVKSSDGTSATFTVDSGTSVNGGELGISSVKVGDTVSVVAVDSNGTATAKEIVDRSQLQSNGSSWMPQPPSSSGSNSSGSTSS